MNHDGHTRGWAYVTMSSAEAAAAAVQALDGAEVLAGRKVHVALAGDKRDVLFPELTAAQRERLHIDPVAHFSIVDMARHQEALSAPHKPPRVPPPRSRGLKRSAVIRCCSSLPPAVYRGQDGFDHRRADGGWLHGAARQRGRPAVPRLRRVRVRRRCGAVNIVHPQDGSRAPRCLRASRRA